MSRTPDHRDRLGARTLLALHHKVTAVHRPLLLGARDRYPFDAGTYGLVLGGRREPANLPR